MREGASRGAVAAMMFLLLTSGTVLAAGVTDTSRIAAGPLPERFVLAEPRVGDTAVYSWARVHVADDGTVSVLNEHEALGFAWLPPSRESDFDGVRHDALMLHQWGWQPKDPYADAVDVGAGGWERYAEPVFALQVGTDRVLSYAYLSEATENPERQDPMEARTVQRMFVEADDRFSPRCGAYPAFGGRAVPLDREVDLFRACEGFFTSMMTDAHTPVRAVGTQRLGEHDSVLFSSEANTFHVWYNASIPVPLRIAAQRCEDGGIPFGLGCDEGQYDVLRLTSFRRGDAALPDRATPPSGGEASAWDVRPLVGGLPDESGIAHPFPASEAVALARAHRNGTAFAQAMERGALTFLDHREMQWDGITVRTWDLTASDGVRSASVTVARREGAGPVAAGGPLPLPPLQAARGQAATTDVQVTEDRGNTPLPPLSEMPRTAPTVASMWTRWNAFASESYRNAAPNTWGFRVGCITTAEGGCSVFVERWAGVDRSSSFADGTWSALASRLTESHHEGRGHEMTLNEQWYRTSAPSDGRTMQVESTAARGQLTVIRSTAWVAPAAPVVVGSAFAAAIASLGYLFWPAIRFGAVALFTRNATPPDALRHPVRSRMMGIVRDRPGLEVPELARALGRARSPTEHHLAMLQRVGLVRIARSGPRRLVYACDADPSATHVPPALRSEIAQAILDRLRADPASGVRNAARALGVSPGTVTYHVARLREAGLLPSK